MAVGVGITQIVLKFCPEMAGEGPIHSEFKQICVSLSFVCQIILESDLSHDLDKC